ncbi:MAG: hypothetical protein J7501_02050 [Bdellovibrio sp.]|nr:hypothetical protein [Bdellovibrio sp.]
MTKKLMLLPFLLFSQNLFAGFGVDNTGGMDGGGGGTLPSKPAITYQIREIAEYAKPEVLFLLNAYERFGGFASSSIYAKLFGGARRAQEVLKELRLEVRLDRPCYTSDGKEVDGSIYATKANTICLSAARIAPKTDVAVARREVIALLLHEVSHFMGATEQEAVDFQKEISESIQHVTVMPTYLDQQTKTQVTTYFSTVVTQLRDGVAALDKNDHTRAQDSLGKAIDQIYLARDYIRDGGNTYSLFSPQEWDYQELLIAQLSWAAKFAQTLDSNDTAARAEYDGRFQGRESFDFAEVSYDRHNVYNSMKINKLHSAMELRNYVATLVKDYDIRTAYVISAIYGMRWINLNGHTSSAAFNPWKKYLGRYIVQSVNCDYSNPYNDKKEFQVLVESDRVYLNEITSTGYGYNGLELGDYNVNAYLNSYGEISEGEVYALYENGGSWQRNPNTSGRASVVRLKKTGLAEFELTKSSHYFPNDITQPDQVQTCVYKGVVK